jgi:HEAT repeats
MGADMARTCGALFPLAVVFAALSGGAVSAAPPDKVPSHLDEKYLGRIFTAFFTSGDEITFLWAALKKDDEKVLPYVEYILNSREMETSVVERAMIFTRENLTKFDCKKLVDPTVARLMHERWEMVSEAEMLLDVIGSREECPAVAELLHSESPYNRIGAAITLAKLGDKRELFVLDRWMAGEGMDKHYAIAAGKKARDALRERLEKEAKAKPTEPTEADKVVAKFADADAKVRVAAVESLKKVGSRADSTAVVALLHDPDAKVREAAAEWLGAVGGKRELIALEIRLREPKATDDAAFDAVAKAKKAVAERVDADEKKLKAKSPDAKPEKR